MPLAVSSDNSILVHSSIYVHQLADSIAACIYKQTDAYTMLVDAVWGNMDACCGNTTADDSLHSTSSMSVAWPVYSHACIE